MPAATDFAGLAYYGEYPLSAAAVLDDNAAVRVLMTHRANPDMQDSNGNTVMHLMVIYDNLKMLELLVKETKANLTIKNKQVWLLARNELYKYVIKYFIKYVIGISFLTHRKNQFHTIKFKKYTIKLKKHNKV